MIAPFLIVIRDYGNMGAGQSDRVGISPPARAERVTRCGQVQPFARAVDILLTFTYVDPFAVCNGFDDLW